MIRINTSNSFIVGTFCTTDWIIVVCLCSYKYCLSP